MHFKVSDQYYTLDGLPESEIFSCCVLDSGGQNSVADFTESFNGYPDAIIQEADDRDLDSVLSIANYLDIQARNIAAYPAFVPCELHLAQLLILNNDLMSYNKEQAVDRDQYNSITVLTQQDDAMDLEGATPWVSAYNQKLQADFRDGLLRMPSFGLERDAQVQEYLGLLELRSQRYFGSQGSEIQVTRRVPLLAKIEMDAKLTREDAVPPIEL
ncbi:hypothetical protein B0H13DRAFT_1882719 [Mycena leptocephala]|nr:hypothetical protein B0H13DRAFT_1882719 [Mycena leptocephala]